MKDGNVKFLEDSLFVLGFGDKLNEQLKAYMKENQPEFQLHFSNEQKAPGTEVPDKIQYELHFKRAKEVDMYFFNSYTAKLTDAKEQSKEQLFYVNKNKGVTSKEAYNLLSGRAVNKNLVNKEGQKYNAWIQLDFSNKDKYGNYMTRVFHEKYQFDIKEGLAQLPIKGKEAGFSDSLLNSLHKGNLTPVTFIKEGKELKHFIAANPQYKNIDVFDENGKHLFHTKNKQEETKNENKDEAKTAKKSTVPKKTSGTKKKTDTTKGKKPRTRVAETASGKSLKK